MKTMIIHQIEQTHFSDSEALIIQFILNKGMDIKNMTTKEIAEATGLSINTALGRMRYAVLNMRRMANTYNIAI